jgi:hypothetical protein
MNYLKFGIFGWSLITVLSCDAKERQAVEKVPVENTSQAIVINSLPAEMLEKNGDTSSTRSREVFEEEEEEKKNVKPVMEDQSALPPSKDKQEARSDEEGKIKDVSVDTGVSLTEETPSDIPNTTESVDSVIKQSEEEVLKVDFSNSLPFLDQLNTLLGKYVDVKGNVDYKGLKRNKKDLDALYDKIISISPQDDWSRDQALAYWINLYNVATLKLIVNNYPTTSITKLEGGKPWDKKWIKVGGRLLSLNNIENDIIRPEFKEPRIHFAVNCAAASCPPLLNEAFDPGRLDKQLEKQTRAFLNDSAYNSISGSKLKLSKIFNWYKEDFGDLKDYITPYVETNIVNASISFLEYDWALNQQ